MGYRLDWYYVFAYRTHKGNTNEALAVLATIPLDETCVINASPTMCMSWEQDENGDDIRLQRGARVTVRFRTVFRKDWKSPTLDAIDALLESPHDDWDGDLFTMEGGNECANLYGLEQWESVDEQRARNKAFVDSLQERGQP